MTGHTSQVDYYTLLQVAPDASSAEIANAYERLQQLYSAERMQSAAPEFQAQAAQKREQLTAAYQILSDGSRRAAYDRQRQAVQQATERLDYRPLPPARGQERVVAAEPLVERPRPGRPVQRSWLRQWLLPLGIAALTLALLLLLVLSGVRTTDGAAALATPTVPGIQLPFSPAQIEQFRAAAEGSNTAATWTALGNALFDNAQMLRENAPHSPQYRGTLQNWLAAAQAYERSLALQDDPTVRSDRAVALFNYGVDAPDSERVRTAVAEVERGVQANVTAPRALLNYGLILSSLNPPRTEEALVLWRKVIEVAPQSTEAQRAQALLQSYGQQ